MSTIPATVATNALPAPPLILGITQPDLEKICEEQDRSREAIKERFGVLNIVSELIREARDEQ